MSPKIGTDPFRFGAAGVTYHENYLDGLLDEIGFWRRLLTWEERNLLYNNGNGLSYESFEGEFSPPNNLLEGLISHWKLDEASGNAIDSHGTNTLTSVSGVSSATGKIGNARNFLVVNQSLQCASNASLATGNIDFTISFWTKVNDTQNKIIVSKWDLTTMQNVGLGSGTGEYYLGVQAGNFILGVHDGSAPTTGYATGGPISAGVWYHVVFWHDSVNNQIGLAINGGVPAVYAHSSGVQVKSFSFQIGGDMPVANMYGLVDEVSFWKRMLTPAERTILYNGGSGFPYYSFDDNPPVFPVSAFDTITVSEGVSFPASGSMQASGGIITTVGGSTIHTFTAGGTFEVTAGSGEVAVLIVGGGGAGGRIGPDANGGGGGGAGQVRVIATRSVAVGSYAVVVGAGGLCTQFVADATHNGAVSSFDGVPAIGGGGGAGVQFYPGGNVGRSGASGGGGCGSFAGGTGTAGFNGGSGIQAGSLYGGGGGGGAGAVGVNGTGTAGGAGGTGVSNYFSGTPTFYGGGGGGGTFGGPPAGAGGDGGGGAGKAGTGNGSPGVANTGGGGGGAGRSLPQAASGVRAVRASSSSCIPRPRPRRRSSLSSTRSRPARRYPC